MDKQQTMLGAGDTRTHGYVPWHCLGITTLSNHLAVLGVAPFVWGFGWGGDDGLGDVVGCVGDGVGHGLFGGSAPLFVGHGCHHRSVTGCLDAGDRGEFRGL